MTVTSLKVRTSLGAIGHNLFELGAGSRNKHLKPCVAAVRVVGGYERRSCCRAQQHWSRGIGILRLQLVQLRCGIRRYMTIGSRLDTGCLNFGNLP